MSIISNITEITGVGSNETALDAILSNGKEVFGKFHVRLNIATGCNFNTAYGWFYNDTPYTFNYLYAIWDGVGGWAGRGDCQGNILDDPGNAMTCPAAKKTLFSATDIDNWRFWRLREVKVLPGQKIWIGEVIREDGSLGGTYKDGYLYVTRPDNPPS